MSTINETRVTFFMPTKLVEEMQAQMKKEGYGVKDKSRWISEAIENLGKIENHLELINSSDDLSNLDSKQTIRISKSLKTHLNKIVLDVKKRFFELDGVQSRVIRTSIMQRILRG